MPITLERTRYKDRASCVHDFIDTAHHYGFSHLSHALKDGQKHPVQTYGFETLAPHEDALRIPARTFAEKHSYIRTGHRLGYDVHTIKHGSGKSARLATCIAFHIAGTRKAVAEATLISLAHAALSRVGIKNTIVHINALGNHESAQRYNKELSNFLRRTLPHTQTILDEIHAHPRRVLARLISQCAPCVESAPNPMDYLNDEAREHVKKLLEYLESQKIPYALDPTVVGSSDVWDYIVFDIRATGDTGMQNSVCIQPEILAHGGRYSPLIRRAHKQGVDVACVMLTLDAEAKLRVSDTKKITDPLPTTNIFFGHVSEVAKKVSLTVVRMLHDAGIFVHHALTRDTLTQQLAVAKNPEYMVVIGHKEALEGTAIVRNEATRVQKEIPITELASYLKKLAK